MSNWLDKLQRKLAKTEQSGITDIDRLHDTLRERNVNVRQTGKTFARCHAVAGAIEVGEELVGVLLVYMNQLNYVRPMLISVLEEHGFTITRSGYDFLEVKKVEDRECLAALIKFFLLDLPYTYRSVTAVVEIDGPSKPPPTKDHIPFKRQGQPLSSEEILLHAERLLQKES